MAPQHGAAHCRLHGHDGQVTIVGPEGLTEDALSFWSGQMEIVSEDLKIWLGQTVRDLQVLWGDVARMNRSRDMWMALSEAIEAIDPTNPWVRNYDAMYFDAQLLCLT